jgi:hypothetical protein
VRTELGILLIMILLGFGGVYNLFTGSLTVLEYYKTEVADIASVGASFTIAMGIFVFVVIYGMAKRKGWALFLSIAFMSFGIISSIFNIIYSTRFELSSTFGILGVILFSIAIYYLTRQHVRAVFKQ